MGKLNDISSIAARWSAGASGAKDRYVKGVNSVQEADNPMAKAAAAVDKWQTAVSSSTAREKYIGGLQGRPLSAWSGPAAGKGATNYQSSVRDPGVVNKTQQFWNDFGPVLKAASDQVNSMPSNTEGDRDQKMLALVARLRQYRRKR